MSLSRRNFLKGATAIAVTASWLARAAEPTEQQRIEAALPSRAAVKPRRPRKLLIFDRNVGYGGHPSAKIANTAFTRMGQKTGAFETTVSSNPEVFHRESLQKFDAVFFNNTVGNLFTDPVLRQNLIEFVYSGGGLLGVHGTSVAFTRWPEGAKEDWPEFALMLGTRGAAHMPGDGSEEVIVKLDDPTHPLNRVFDGKSFPYRSEFFRFHDPYSRNRVRVLLSMDNAATEKLQGAPLKPFRKDNDYAIAWVRNYGRGRVFYCSLGHNPYIFWDPKMLAFYLDAIQFALGDLDTPTLPSAKLTPAVRAQEQLGWRLGFETHTSTLFDAIEKTAQLGLSFLGGSSLQQVSAEIPRNFDLQLTEDEWKQIRLKLDAHSVRLLTYHVPQIPDAPTERRKLLAFARKIGVETLVTESARLDAMDKLCDQYDIRVAIRAEPETVLKACAGRSQRLGGCFDLCARWERVKDRLMTVHARTISQEALHELHRLGIQPTMFALESTPDVAKNIESFNKISLDLAK